MSKKLLSVLLAELTTIRIHCPTCDGVVELPVGKVESQYAHNPVCRLCGAGTGIPPGANNCLVAAARAIAEYHNLLKHPAGVAAVEFVIPADVT